MEYYDDVISKVYEVSDGPPITLPPQSGEDEEGDSFKYKKLFRATILIPEDKLKIRELVINSIPSIVHGEYDTEEQIGKFYIDIDTAGIAANDIYSGLIMIKYTLEAYFAPAKSGLHVTTEMYNLHQLIYDLFTNKFNLINSDFYIKDVYVVEEEGTI